MKKKPSPKNGHRYAQETKLIWGEAYTPKWDYSHHVIPPISSSSTFRLDSSQRGARGFVEFAHHGEDFRVHTKEPIYIYDRLGEPNKDLLEENLAMAEGSECAVTFASGMGAVSALCGILLGSGSEIVAHRTLYGCTYSLFKNWMPRYRVKVTWVDFTDLKALANAVSPQTRLLYFETPVNPTLELIDLNAVAEIARSHNRHRKPENMIHTAVDNTFATPFCQRPIEAGIDFVVESLTKGLCGFGTDVGGVVAGPSWSYDRLLMYRKDFGGILSPKAAWPILVYGLPSLAVRLRQQMQNAQVVAEALERDDRVRSVRFPGLDTFPQRSLAHVQMHDYDGRFAPGTMVYFTVVGDSAGERHANAKAVVDFIAEHSYTLTLAVSLGSIRTLIEHPGSMTHSSIPPERQLEGGMDPGGIRLSVGLENPDDIIHDLREAFEHARISKLKRGNGQSRTHRKAVRRGRLALS